MIPSTPSFRGLPKSRLTIQLVFHPLCIIVHLDKADFAWQLVLEETSDRLGSWARTCEQYLFATPLEQGPDEMVVGLKISFCRCFEHPRSYEASNTGTVEIQIRTWTDSVKAEHLPRMALDLSEICCIHPPWPTWPPSFARMERNPVQRC
jgi:hypothetical protein